MAKRACLVLVAVLAAAGCSSGGSSSKPAVSASPSATGNGVEKLAPKDIVSQSVAALKAGQSAHLSGQTSQQGQSVTLDLSMDTGGNCSGTVSQVGQGTFKLIKLAKQVWLKPDPGFWQSHGGPAVAQLVGDKYLRTTSDNPDFTELTSICDLGQIADSIAAGVDTLAAGSTTTVDGTPAVTVTGTKGGTTGTLYVATTGRPYPLRLEKSGTEAGTLNYKDFGVPVPSTAPGPDQSIDIDELNRETASQSPSAAPSSA